MSPCNNNISLWIAFFAVLFSTGLYADEMSLDARLNLLVESYPEALSHHKNNLLYFNNGMPPIQIDDGRQKSHAEKLEDADIEDSLSQIYPAGPCKSKHQLDFDPGRIRSDKLMRILYGASKSDARKNLTAIDWYGQKILVSKRYGAAKALLAVRDEIALSPKLLKYAKKIGGTFNWRNIAGTSRLSAHSFGIAIDMDTAYANYWRWTKLSEDGLIRPIINKYPFELVSIFEKHGFIWGGRWYHYDTMHFEYRPELLAISRLSASGNACDN